VGTARIWSASRGLSGGQWANGAQFPVGHSRFGAGNPSDVCWLGATTLVPTTNIAAATAMSVAANHLATMRAIMITIPSGGSEH
jgi:hypothetical protein